MGYSPPPSARPFSLKISDSDYSDLLQSIEISSLGPLTYDNAFDDGRHGISYHWMKRAKEYWQHEFDWRAQEKRINSFPNYKMDIEDEKGDVEMHFVGLWSQRQNAKPLVLLHGWPGSFLEFLPALEVLSARHGTDLPFHVIVPSLPGYALSSGPPTDADWKAKDAARIVHTMVTSLGFEQYIVQGGDVGSWIAALLATTYEEVVGIHRRFRNIFSRLIKVILTTPVNMLVTLDSVDPKDPELSTLERDVIERGSKRFVAPTVGAAIMNSTRPATIGILLHASPIALLAW